VPRARAGVDEVLECPTLHSELQPRCARRRWGNVMAAASDAAPRPTRCAPASSAGTAPSSSTTTLAAALVGQSPPAGGALHPPAPHPPPFSCTAPTPFLLHRSLGPGPRGAQLHALRLAHISRCAGSPAAPPPARPRLHAGPPGHAGAAVPCASRADASACRLLPQPMASSATPPTLTPAAGATCIDSTVAGASSDSRHWMEASMEQVAGCVSLPPWATRAGGAPPAASSSIRPALALARPPIRTAPAAALGAPTCSRRGPRGSRPPASPPARMPECQNASRPASQPASSPLPLQVRERISTSTQSRSRPPS
jgi:hypothetical protein